MYYYEQEEEDENLIQLEEQVENKTDDNFPDVSWTMTILPVIAVFAILNGNGDKVMYYLIIGIAFAVGGLLIGLLIFGLILLYRRIKMSVIKTLLPQKQKYINTEAESVFESTVKPRFLFDSELGQIVIERDNKLYYLKWNFFKGYLIKDKTIELLFPFKRSWVLVITESKIGIEKFQKIFMLVIENVNHLSE